MSVLSSKARLAGLTKQLVMAWEDISTSWTDDKAREFHQRYLVHLVAEVDKTVSAMEDLEKLIQKVTHECD